jgi:beta-lactamase regulating signal transducer with metallopeptidase domain
MIALADIWIAVLSGVGIALSAGVVIGVVGPFAIRPLRRVSPGARSIILNLTAIAPLIAGLLGAKLIAHHCHADIAACASHARADNSTLLMALGAGTLGALVVWFGLSAFDLVSQSNRSVRLLRAASDGMRNGAALLKTNAVVAVSAGLVRPRIYIGDAFSAALEDKDLKVILAHEEAHGARRDALVRLLTALLSVGQLPHFRLRLLSELELAQEQLCDRKSAEHYGAIATAETLLKVERLKQTMGSQSHALCTAFGQSDIEARTRALILPDFRLTYQAVLTFTVLAIMGAITLFIAAEPVHHEVESLFLSLQN